MRAGVVAATVIAVVAIGIPLLRYQHVQASRSRCLNNERRLATALLLYAQDHDGRLPTVDYQVAGRGWRTWLGVLEPYIAQQDISICPVNAAPGAREPYHGYPYPYSYALNQRFSDVFEPGPFPIENLELPAQTALIVEAGPYRAGGPFSAPSYPWAMSGYWDTAWWPNVYPSPHERRMNVAAADGHVTSIRVAHYRQDGHDALLGRLGGSVYNWNGGHPNGDTGGPPRE